MWNNFEMSGTKSAVLTKEKDKIIVWEKDIEIFKKEMRLKWTLEEVQNIVHWSD